ncbi:MAG TPA: DNA translocase FtsK 4TM domain-containing protein, partial [Actinomycetota bacterium]
MAKKRKKKARGGVTTAGKRVVEHLKPRYADAVGIGLLVLGGLSALGIWLDGGGPVGRFLDGLARGGFGLLGYLFPVLALWWGLVLVRGTAEQERGRMLVGLTFTLMGGLGLLSLFRGNPSPASGLTGFGDAGGLIGSLTAWPLSRLASSYGAAIVCLGLFVLGLLVFTATPMSAVWEWVRGLRGQPAEGQEERSPRRRLRDMSQEEVTEAASWEEMGEEEPEEEAEPEEAEEPEPARAAPRRPSRGDYAVPPLKLLRKAPAGAGPGRDEKDVMATLERTLRQFGVDASVAGATRGPTVTLYEVGVAAGTKVNRV